MISDKITRDRAYIYPVTVLFTPWISLAYGLITLNIVPVGSDTTAPGSLLHLFNRMGERPGVLNVHTHLLRHTFAVQYLRNGGDVFTLQRQQGDSTLEMVKRYFELSQADDYEAHKLASPADRWHLL